jgi:hypothetical protein
MHGFGQHRVPRRAAASLDQLRHRAESLSIPLYIYRLASYLACRDNHTDAAEALFTDTKGHQLYVCTVLRKSKFAHQVLAQVCRKWCEGV